MVTHTHTHIMSHGSFVITIGNRYTLYQPLESVMKSIHFVKLVKSFYIKHLHFISSNRLYNSSINSAFYLF